MAQVAEKLSVGAWWIYQLCEDGTCDANGVERIAYLTDVLGRSGSHPAAGLDNLLPHKWRQSA